MSDWKRPARMALLWAGIGIIFLVVGLLLDRFTDILPIFIWLMIIVGMIGVVAGAFIMLNAVAPRRGSHK